MKPRHYLLSGMLLVASLAGQGAVTPPAERLLPPDTLALLSIPDWSKVREDGKTSAVQMLWNDPAIRPFREKLLGKLQTEVLDKLEKDTGIRLAEYGALLQGQLSLAITRNGWSGTADPLPGFVLILDARDKGDELKARLAELRKKLTDAGQTLKTQTIRDTEFTALPLDVGQQPDGQAAKADDTAPKLTLSFGQVGSVLVAGLQARDLERVVGLLSGAGMPHLAEEAPFSADQQAFFREARAFGWIHFSPLADVITKLATAAAGESGAGDMAPKPDKLLAALGLKGLKTLAFGVREMPEGSFVDLSLSAPWQERKGLLKLLATESKDAGVPGFVPADAVAFWRWRLDGQKLWASLEAMADEIQPGLLAGAISFLDAAMKEKNPDFDFKRSFIMNLGDDLIGYQKAPKSLEPKDLLSQPSLFLVGSANADKLLAALRLAVALLPEPLSSAPIQDREFLGRRIYSLNLPDMTGSGGGGQVHSAASGGYVLLASEPAILEEYLRSSEVKPKPLSEFPGLREAAQSAGGTGSGLFGFQNDAEQLKPFWQALRTQKGLFLDLASAQNPAVDGLLGENKDEIEDTIASWVDFSLLPEFDRVAKYFHLSVYAGKVSTSGYTLRMFTPRPPSLKN